MREVDKDGGRVAIVLNGSPLFTGAAGSGESEIRRYLIENDLLEGVIALPEQLFYNTGIATYIWVVTNRKSAEREGKVQLVDARDMFVKMRKSLGDKRRLISEEFIEELGRLYGAFEENDRVKIMPNEAFGYRTIVVEQPLRARWEIGPDTWTDVGEEKAMDKLYSESDPPAACNASRRCRTPSTAARRTRATRSSRRSSRRFRRCQLRCSRRSSPGHSYAIPTPNPRVMRRDGCLRIPTSATRRTSPSARTSRSIWTARCGPMWMALGAQNRPARSATRFRSHGCSTATSRLAPAQRSSKNFNTSKETFGGCSTRCWCDVDNDAGALRGETRRPPRRKRGGAAVRLPRAWRASSPGPRRQLQPSRRRPRPVVLSRGAPAAATSGEGGRLQRSSAAGTRID